MRRLNSKLSTDSTEKWKIPYLDIIAVGAIQFSLALLILCYGVYLMVLVLEEEYDLKTTLWTAVIFVTAFKITNPWVRSYCKYLDKNRYKVHKRNIIIAVILQSIALAVTSFIYTLATQMILYGAFGGFLSAFIHEHLRSSTSDTFSNQPYFFENLNMIVKPLCMILMPHLILFVSDKYSAIDSQVILSGILLNIIPFCLLTKTKTYQRKPLCKFQTVERLSFEMIDLHSKTPAMLESSSSSEESDEGEMEVSPELTVQPHTSSPTVQDYYQNVGVKILPNIPEEDESEDDDINEISSKRLSRISAILQDLNETDQRDITLSVNNLYQPDEGIESVGTKLEEVENYAEEFDRKKARCFSISSNKMYAFIRKKEKTKDFLKDHFVKSFQRTLSKPCFYPTLISNSITTTLATVILTTAPYLMLVKNTKENNAITTVDATFWLTSIGFSWIFFLAGHPVFNKLSHCKVKILFLAGLSISAFSLFIAQKFSYDNFPLSALTFGLGHGILAYTENKTYEYFFGNRNWQNLQAALEISTGFIVILIYLIIYLSNLEIDDLLNYAYWPYIGVVALWIIMFIIEQIVTRIKHIKRFSGEKYPNFDSF